jgi:RNA polymerase sigma-70 factor, ECF subfamily
MAGGHADDVLVTAARAGDHDAWRRLYELHAARLLAWLRSLPHTDAASSADDVASEAWLTAAAKIGELRGGDDDFAPWLFTIARNHASNSRRKGLRRQTDPVDVQESPEAFGAVHDDTEAVEGSDRTRRLLALLSPREAEVVACIDVVGLDVAATAQVLGMRPTAVRVARHRALGRLRAHLGDADLS